MSINSSNISKVDKLEICSLNVRGLSNDVKRRETFNWLRNKKHSVYFLQEVHSSSETEKLWLAEWGYIGLFSSLSSSRAGVCILFNNNFAFEILKYYSDPEGRFITVDIKTQDKIITLQNIYAPNNDDRDFFKNVFNNLSTFECEHIVLGGDFNLVQNISKDKKGGNQTTHFKSLEEIEMLKENMDLTDIWRDLHPSTQRFTWRRNKPEIHCRLDFFLISSSLSTDALEANILPGFKTDHSLITLSLATKTNPRGPGFWKLNSHLLKDLEYINLIKETINEVSNDYKEDETVDAILLWDVMKMQIRANSIKYAKQQKAKQKQTEKTLETEILKLELKLEDNISDDEKCETRTKLEVKKQNLEQVISYKTQGSIIRSRTRWYNEGEKNTKYFFGLEKRHYNSKTIRNLKIDDNTVLNTDQEILNEARRFYQTLYTSNSCSSQEITGEDLFFQQNNQCKISDDERKLCEGLLTAAECLESLKTMESNKTPGTDGIPAEFYKIFWNDIKSFLLASINASYAKGLLSISQRRGLITLIPKKDKSLCYIKNWRPISLLNCDYKIAAKSIASRIKRVLPSVINSDQTGFQKNRFIGENIRLLNSILSYTDIEKLPGLLLFIDFEKAFDTLEWTFVEKTLKYYNFGNSLISWIKLFYTDISSSIQNNGWTSDFFNLSRGVRQGCPLSPYLFILCAEILGAAIRRDKLIYGIKILDKECKVSQYADDTTLILDGTKPSIDRSFLLLDIFAKLSGLKVNYEKTEALWIGSFKNRTDKLAIKQNIKWTFRKVKSLGVWFSTSVEEAAMLNYQEKKEKISKILNCWQVRRLTLLGKITVIKSLAASQLVYIMSPLPSSQSHLKEIHQILYNFLWDGRGDKIKRSVMLNEYKDGGLKMLHIQSFNCALKAKWVQKYLDDSNQAKWKLFFDYFIKEHDGKLLLTGNLNQADVAGLNIQDTFTKEVIEIWSSLNYEENLTDFGNTPIWYNSLIRIANQPIFYRKWSRVGVNQAKDILDHKSDFLKYEDFESRYKVKTTFLTYYGVVSATAKLKKSFQDQVTMNSNQPTCGQKLLSASNICKEAYKLIVKKSLQHRPIARQNG